MIGLPSEARRSLYALFLDMQTTNRNAPLFLSPSQSLEVDRLVAIYSSGDVTEAWDRDATACAGTLPTLADKQVPLPFADAKMPSQERTNVSRFELALGTVAFAIACALGVTAYNGMEAAPSHTIVKAQAPASSIAPIPAELKAVLLNTQQQTGMDARLLAAIFYVENRHWPKVNSLWQTSQLGARGPFQLMPSTCPDSEAQDLSGSALCAAVYLMNVQGHSFAGKLSTGSVDNRDWRTVAGALAVYNAGPGGKDALFPETQHYVQAGLSYYLQLQNPTIWG